MSKISWFKRNRLPLQITALLLAVLSPFALFAALQSGSDPLAILFSTLFALAMILIFLAG